jgi:hypothetical protein
MSDYFEDTGILDTVVCQSLYNDFILQVL